MNTFSLVFLFFLTASALIHCWLALRQANHVAAHRQAVPEAFRQHIDLSAHQRAADYTLAKLRSGHVEHLLAVLVLLAWTLGGGLDWLDTQWRALGLGEMSTGIAFILSAMLISALLDLPLALYRTFGLENRFGFNRTTPQVFVSDTLKQLLVSLVIGVPILWLVLWLMGNAGTWWWLYAWASWTGFSLLMMWAYPTLIAPLFNQFKPLENPELRHVVEGLLARCGFESNGIFIMDGSRRSSHGNAYFTGMGRNKRIVFYDTLIQSLTPAQIEAVLAHELGHFRRNHIRKRMISLFALSLTGFGLLGWLSQQDWFYHGLGMQTPSVHAALMLFLFVSPVFAFWLQPLSALISRKHEYEADAFAAQHSSSSQLVQALVTLYQENASTLTPDWLYSAFHDSHPPAPLRIAHLQQAADETRT